TLRRRPRVERDRDRTADQDAGERDRFVVSAPARDEPDEIPRSYAEVAEGARDAFRARRELCVRDAHLAAPKGDPVPARGEILGAETEAAGHGEPLSTCFFTKAAIVRSVETSSSTTSWSGMITPKRSSTKTRTRESDIESKPAAKRSSSG